MSRCVTGPGVAQGEHVLTTLLRLQVIMATNRIETLDPALLRPGRIDRKIEFPLPDSKTKRRIFNIHVSRMSLADDVNLEEFVMSKDELSGADIKAMCTEAGLLALRERRMKVRYACLLKALRAVLTLHLCRGRSRTLTSRRPRTRCCTRSARAFRRACTYEPLLVLARAALADKCRLHPTLKESLFNPAPGVRPHLARHKR